MKTIKMNDFYKAKLIRDDRKWKNFLGEDADLLGLVRDGLVAVVGLRNKGREKGELEYTATEEGKKHLAKVHANEADNIVSLLNYKKALKNGESNDSDQVQSTEGSGTGTEGPAQTS